ncbi:MAG: hypothetical protein U5R30_14800 [Deltaproteobacteria bacterium]|nr:hypothetical protein [Deltaproteobacteria bacterium]
MTIQYQKLAGKMSADDFIKQELARINTGRGAVRAEPQDIVLYGFGRIGRLLARILIEKSGSGEKLRIRAAVVRKGGADDLFEGAPVCCAGTQFMASSTVLLPLMKRKTPSSPMVI